MNKIQLETVEINEKDRAYLGRAIAVNQSGHHFIILAANDDGIFEAWYRLGSTQPPDFDQVRNVAIVSRAFFDAVCPKYDAPSPTQETFPSPPISPWPSSQQFDCLKCANGQTLTYMIVCPTCGNKRCPKASDHDLDCTNSNAPGQPGSQF